jgi:hypothetical protein
VKLIIAGPRDLYPDEDTIFNGMCQVANKTGLRITKLITGGASGVDVCARRYALKHAFSTCEFEADWKKYGRKAGPIRNARMAEEADALLVIKRLGKETPGTNNMILTAEKRGMPVYIEEVEG